MSKNTVCDGCGVVIGENGYILKLTQDGRPEYLYAADYHSIECMRTHLCEAV